ncbi:hypothetical protein HK097_005645, partial [Rhizophlyctis rosea]
MAEAASLQPRHGTAPAPALAAEPSLLPDSELHPSPAELIDAPIAASPAVASLEQSGKPRHAAPVANVPYHGWYRDLAAAQPQLQPNEQTYQQVHPQPPPLTHHQSMPVLPLEHN